MTWLASIALAMFLLCCEWLPCSKSASAFPCVIGVVIASLVTPLFATMQTMIVARRWSSIGTECETRWFALRVLNFACLAVWLSSSLAIIYVLDWPVIARGNWGLDRWPLLDEIVILLPIVMSLTAAWMLLFRAERTLGCADPLPTTANELRASWQQAAGRWRLLAGLMLLPLAVLIFSRDLIQIMAPASAVDSWMMAAFVINAILLVCLFPTLISKTWKTRPLSDLDLRQRLQRCTEQLGMRPINTRRWDTGQQLVNAVVVGILPTNRTVFLSDMLLQHFEPDEIEAIYRHEMAHLRCGHLPLRLFYFAWPMVIAVIISWQSGFGSNYHWTGWMGLALVAALYLAVFLNWVVRQSEIEADLVACTDIHHRFDPVRAAVYRRALLKMAAWNPELYGRGTLAHPSIKNRLRQLAHFSVSLSAATAFRRGFAWRQITFVVVTACLSAMMLLL